MDNIELMLMLDVAAVSLCTLLLWKYGNLGYQHPATIYLIFHVTVVTFRLVVLLVGAQTLFTNWRGQYDPVTYPEIITATLLADLIIFLMTLAWIKAHRDDARKTAVALRKVWHKGGLSSRYIWYVVLVVFPIGFVALLLLTRLPVLGEPRVDLGEWSTSTWALTIQTWCGLALLMLIYRYGFRLVLLAPMAIYLMIMLYQGFHRFRVVIPIIFLSYIYLDQRRLRWPPLKLVGAMVICVLLFIPMKAVGRMWQSRAAFAEILDYMGSSIQETYINPDSDMNLVDGTAATLTLVDEGKRFYYGETYFALLVNPVPRQWWEEKPGLNDFLKDISTDGRPLAKMGTAVGLIGELYANFGYPGLTLVPMLLAYWLARLYFRAYRAPYYSITRLSYLVVACILIQVYRDGLISLVLFTLVHMMPFCALIALHWILPVRARQEDPNLFDSGPPASWGLAR